MKSIHEIILKLITLSLLKVKMIFLFAYLGMFAVAYCIDISWEKGLKIDFTQPDFGTGEIVFTGLLILFLITLDVFFMIKKDSGYISLLKHPNVPDDVKRILAGDLKNNK